MDAVTPILVDRAREPQGLRNMVVVSLAAHAVGTFAILFMPHPTPGNTTPREVMTISLNSGPVNSGGMTSMGGRATEAAPPEPKRAPERPAAAKVPEMVLPTKQTKPTPTKPHDAAEDARGKVLPKAAETRKGDAPIETGAKGQGFGLSTGGNAGTSGYLDVQNFCCPEYLGTMLQLIQRNWSSRQQVAGDTVVRFTIQRDGRLTDIEVEKSSGYFALDQMSQRALVLTRQLPPLPGAFTEPTLTVHLIFRYER
jgi:periplasmic protein TonB